MVKKNEESSIINEKKNFERLFKNQISGEWLTTKQAADYLGKTANAVRIAVHRGQLKSQKWRRRLYFKRKDLDKMLSSSFNFGGI